MGEPLVISGKLGDWPSHIAKGTVVDFNCGQESKPDELILFYCRAKLSESCKSESTILPPSPLHPEKLSPDAKLIVNLHYLKIIHCFLFNDIFILSLVAKFAITP